MRTAELVMALVLAAASIGFMLSAKQLPIGYIEGEGPGAGAFPFWLGAGMLVCCLWTIVRWALRATPPSRSDQPFMTREALAQFIAVAGSLGVMIGLIHFVGVYVAVPLFLVFYIRFLGGHSWLLALVLAVSAPVLMFFFFEVALTITLPKGVTEEFFYPLYDRFM